MTQVLNLCFFVGRASQVAAFGVSGKLGVDTFVATLPLTAVALAALAVGLAVQRRLPASLYARALRYAFLSGLVLEFITSVAIALVAVTLGVRVISGGMPFADAFLVLLLAPEFYRPLRELGTHHHAGMEGKAAAAQIFAILDEPVAVQGAGKTPLVASSLPSDLVKPSTAALEAE